MSAFATLCLLACDAAFAQRTPRPDLRDPAVIEAGKAAYLKACASCHGQNARGGEASDLFKSRIVLQEAPGPLAGVIRNGIPGTEMAPQKLDDTQVLQLVAYLRFLTQPALQPPAPGDADAGRRVFESHGCASCHMVGGRGGVIGPDLSSVAYRNRIDDIRRSVVDPDASVPPRFRTVTAITRNGEDVTGVLKNEDNFSVQVMKMDGTYALFLRSELRDVVYRPRSLMPSGYGDKLSADELRDLLAFLDRQRAPVVTFEVNFQNY